MRKFLIHEQDGQRWELPPLTYDEFVALNLWSGGSDLAYASWLRLNGFTDPDDLSAETLDHCVLVLVAGDYAELKFEDGDRVFPYTESTMKDSIALQATYNASQRSLATHIEGHKGCLVRIYKNED